MTPLADEIEIWLLAQYGWVSEEKICERFNVEERALRNTSRKSGLLSDFAISGNNGFKHVRNATIDEWDHFNFRIRNHSVRQLLRLKKLRDKRTNLLTGKRPFLSEAKTGQGVLL